MKNKILAFMTLAIFLFSMSVNPTVCASEYTYYFNDYDEDEIEWATDPENMIDGNTSTYASTTEDGDTQLLTGNTCTGTESGTITGVFIRVRGYYTGAFREIVLQPVFSGGDGDNHYFSPPLGEPNADWSDWYNITDDTNSNTYWTWRDVSELNCKVKVGLGMTGYTLYASKVEIKVEYT